MERDAGENESREWPSFELKAGVRGGGGFVPVGAARDGRGGWYARRVARCREGGRHHLAYAERGSAPDLYSSRGIDRPNSSKSVARSPPRPQKGRQKGRERERELLPSEIT